MQDITESKPAYFLYSIS